ncbi:hypothetical protein [Hydrogenivirga sp.]
MLRTAFILTVWLVVAVSHAAGHEDWCPRGERINGSVYVEGIVDYEGVNWCKFVINRPGAKTEIYYTLDGEGQRVVEYIKGKKAAAIEIFEGKAKMKIYDKDGNVIEELKARESLWK